MDDEKVIECVRQYPAIYNMSHPKYLDNTSLRIAHVTF